MKIIKKLLFGLSVFLIISCSLAQEKVPEAVQVAFEGKYPGENDPDWEVDAHGNYESHFKINGIKLRADFKPDGTWIETEQSIKKKELPKVVQKKIEELYSDEEITEIEKVDHYQKGVFYNIEFKQKGKNKDVEMTADGRFLN
ncbi:PepSY-like domain-containing protein [Aquimarina sp. ERC-38]|uniref:PepSY-like domain-containing protein n=1 Tax=Aquimarina sp. ERC-38 TaxID=2949996 RepID=UPI0022466277|nr:PepSY-like domain-containing protein [Aquimarina sp. ERC-38]UZO81132.1 PepSY-like domain-containing protein [Aquimarina sp. ERC-38]